MLKKALFLDRDGIINVDYGYVHRTDQVVFIDGIFKLAAAAKNAGYLVVIITNQAGIGHGYYTETEFWTLMNWIKWQFTLRSAKIDAIYFCPYHSNAIIKRYRRESNCRKPGPGMLLQAANDQKIDLQQSIFIGDKLSDIKAGEAAGVKLNILLGQPFETSAQHTITKLVDAIPFFKANPNFN